MKIGIFGTGNIGGTLARKLAKTGHEVVVTNSGGVEGAKSFADEIGALSVDIDGAVTGVDLIILAIPLMAAVKLGKALFQDVPTHVPIVSTSNYYPDLLDPHIKELDEGKVESVWFSEQIGRPVVKAFNNIPWYSLRELGTEKGEANRIAIAVAGDDLSQKQIVMNLIDTDIGFDPVDSGTLKESWRQQPCTPSYCCDWTAEIMKEKLAVAVKGEAERKRAGFYKKMIELGENAEHSDVIALNRSL